MTEKAIHVVLGPRLTANQFSACVILVFKFGSGNFRASQIRQRLLREDHEGAADHPGGSGGVVDLTGLFCQDWLDAERWRGSFLRPIKRV